MTIFFKKIQSLNIASGNLAQPATVVSKMEAQLKYAVYTLHTYIYLQVLAPICVLSWCLLTIFLHWSSVRSLLRVHYWLGPLSPSVLAHKLVSSKSQYSNVSITIGLLLTGTTSHGLEPRVAGCNLVVYCLIFQLASEVSSGTMSHGLEP